MDVSILSTVAPILVAGVWALIGFANSWLGPDHQPDWSKVIITFCIGIFVAGYMTLSGTVITYEGALLQMAIYMGFIATIDKGMHIVIKLIKREPIDLTNI